MTRLRWSEALSRPWALHSLGEAPSRLKWPARLRRSHRVHDASRIQAEPGTDAPRNGAADAAATGDEPSAASPRLTPRIGGDKVALTGHRRRGRVRESWFASVA